MEQSKDERDVLLKRMTDEARQGDNRERLSADAERSRREKTVQDADAPQPPADAEHDRHEDRMFGAGAPHRAGRRRRRILLRILLLLIVLLAAAILIAVFSQRARSAISGFKADFPDSFAELLPDEEMGYTRTEFVEAILGETRDKAELVVLEQDIQVVTEISQALANIALFEKTQTLISYGTGVYSVDLSELSGDDIVLDEEEKVVKVTIPHATLLYVNFDVTRTESGETHRALFAFGDIKLTPEQDTLLKTSIEAAMREKLSSPEALADADERALVLVRDLLTPLIRAVSDVFSVKIVMPAT